MPAPRPNIVLIHCHDLGRHLGCYGARTVRSPELDALAADGVLVEQMSATAPQCSPSRASLFTGRWPHSNGVLGLTHDHFGWDLHPDERHLASLLGEAGYASELIGMHHESRTGPDAEVADRLGFDSVRTGGLADEVAEHAMAALVRLHDHQRTTGAPFYLQVGFTEPHRLPGARDAPGVMGFLGDHLEPDDELGVDLPPWLADTSPGRAEIAELQGAIRQMDAAAGRVLRAVDEHTSEQQGPDDTVVIFTTDHGLALPRAKCSLYEPGLDVAFLIRWPAGGWTGGRRVAGLVSNVDVVPTLLDVLELSDLSGPPREGISFRPVLDGGPSARQYVFAEMTYHDYYDPRRSVRDERYKLIANFSSAPAFMDPSQGSVRRSTPKPTNPSWEGYHPPLELFDLVDDPNESTDLSGDPDHAADLARLSDVLRTWMEETSDPLLHGAVTGPLHRETTGLLTGRPA